MPGLGTVVGRRGWQSQVNLVRFQLPETGTDHADEWNQEEEPSDQIQDPGGRNLGIQMGGRRPKLSPALRGAYGFNRFQNKLILGFCWGNASLKMKDLRFSSFPRGGESPNKKAPGHLPRTYANHRQRRCFH
ncbi:MAG: hypothetical protein A2931_00020 [Candidatus Niyogibacteria bacterium RIFCSPLOWO2_01_FULL_45_48]|uniref:Uncharacterized protein n=1 Tax=Candidatus Niyogibacteria bacterium RIFCSPLOWO2_01_FULL_45_48 TaxID=1801724 RepID=A0A1G2EW22_9BACT|nr:MAG: hypothetical protein A2931_00020 [Candidatus Niyogibacteria bacterium RIFCSPLOWO2_01_FULL_45_48]